MRVLAVPGSLRRHSHNRGLLVAMAEQAPAGVEVVLFEGLKAVPPFDEDDEHRSEPAPLAAWRAALRGADLVVFATPEYNSSIPGQLKNALDWVSRPIATNALRTKPVAVVGASAGAFGAIWAQAELRKALAKAGARVLECELAVPLAGTVFEDGVCTSAKVRRKAGRFLG